MNQVDKIDVQRCVDDAEKAFLDAIPDLVDVNECWRDL